MEKNHQLALAGGFGLGFHAAEDVALRAIGHLVGPDWIFFAEAENGKMIDWEAPDVVWLKRFLGFWIELVV